MSFKLSLIVLEIKKFSGITIMGLACDLKKFPVSDSIIRSASLIPFLKRTESITFFSKSEKYITFAKFHLMFVNN